MIIIDIVQTIPSFRSAWEARTTDGRDVFIRYRFGRLLVGVGSDMNDAVKNAMGPDPWFVAYHGDEYDGEMDFSEVLDLAPLLPLDGETPPPGRSRFAHPSRPLRAAPAGE